MANPNHPDEPSTIKTLAHDLAGLLSALGIERAHILGASFGGFVAQEFAIAYPHMTRSLILCCTSFGGARVLELIEQYRCTILFGVPTTFQMMLEAPAFETTDFSSLRYFISGGAPCPVPLIEAYQRRGVAFTQGYGLTEVGPNCFKLALKDAVRKAGSIGFPSFHSEARIVDEKGREVERGQVCELILRGGHVCSGYWQNIEATKAALSGCWFYTGDLARQDAEGYY